jgi:hypothetical protein
MFPFNTLIRSLNLRLVAGARRRHRYAWLLALSLAGLLTMSAPAEAYKGTYRVALIEVTFSDTTAAYTPLQLTEAAGEMHDYFDKMSYGQLNLVVVPFEISLPQKVEFYWTASGGLNNVTPTLYAAAAEQAGAEGFDFKDINGISVLTTACLGQGRDFTNGKQPLAEAHVNGTFGQSHDYECPGPPPGPSGVKWGGWAHEIGHQLQIADGINIANWGMGGHPSAYASGYDQMDSCYPCDTSAYSLLGPNVMNGNEKVFSGWMPTGNVVTVNVPKTGSSAATVVLTPIEQNFVQTPAQQAIKVVKKTGGYYLVEARQRLDADALQNHGSGVQGIYDTGVHITSIDETGNPPMTVINRCDYLGAACLPGNDPACDVTTRPANCWPYDLWHVGDTFKDTTNAIEIKVDSAVGEGFEVAATIGVPPGHPDMYIIPWLTPPMNTYETVDIWVDSSCNGYYADVGPKGLRYGVRPDGTVIGNGDDPCANHENRIYATVSNIGDAVANNAVVHFQVSNPLGVGVTGSWSEVGKLTIPTLAAGASTTVFVPWTPTVTLTPAEIASGRFKFHSCVQVIIDPPKGQVVTSGLEAQENFNNFDAVRTPKGAYAPLQGSFMVSARALGEDIAQTVWLQATSQLPTGWTYALNHGLETLTLGGNTPNVTVPVVVNVPDNSPVGESFELAAQLNYIATLFNAAIPPNSPQPATHRGLTSAGGVTLGIQTVLPDEMSLALTLDPKGNITASGAITPALAGVAAIVAVDFEDIAGNTYTRLATADSKGNFTCKLAPWIGNGSTWKVRAFWQGDRQYTSAITAQLPIVVLQANSSVPGSPHTELCL